MVEKIVKAAIIAGIIFVGFIMVVVGITVLPMSLNNINNNMLIGTDEELEKIFLESKEYQSFVERFPDHDREFSRDYHSAQFSVGAMNIDSGNQLIMDMYLYGYSGSRMEKNIHCELSEDVDGEYDIRMMHVNGVMVKSLIETTKCLD